MSKIKIKKEPIYLVGEDTVHISDSDDEEEEENGGIPEEPKCPICDKIFQRELLENMGPHLHSKIILFQIQKTHL